MRLNHSVRAILRNHRGQLLFIKREKADVIPYWVTPGGGVEDTDATLESALRREVMEEMGGQIEMLGVAFELQRELPDGLIQYTTFFNCKLLEYDLTQQSGPEFLDPSSGRYTIEEISPDHEAIQNLNIKPDELKKFLMQ
jgi:8-oxo-dGTP pyrophosphatase MutT (NUDIX family)